MFENLVSLREDCRVMIANNTSEDARLDCHIRAFNQEDIPGIALLFDAADRADQLYKMSSEEDIRESFGDGLSSETTRIIVAVEPSQAGTYETRFLGLGRVSSHFHSLTRERVYHVMLRVHPAARAQGLQHTIARQLVQIARELESDTQTQQAEKVRMLTYVFDRQTSSIEAWEAAGLCCVRIGWTMERRLSKTIPVEPAPSGVTLRRYRYPEDNLPALNAFNSALADYYDFHPISQTAWEREMAAPYSRPDLSWVALSETAPGEMIGFAGCQVNESANKQAGRPEGWIEGIGVIPAFQQRGVGKALLSRCLQSLRDQNLEFALADVDSESIPAVALFRRAGFSVRIALLQYERALGDIKF
jgi:mycothiol synthase